MRRLAMIAFVLGACYSPRYDDCHVKCTDMGCPSGLQCLDNYCRDGTSAQSCESVLGDAGIKLDSLDHDGGPTGPDMDGDGVPDVSDNCPNDINPDQANEDGDGLGDVCDPCPPFKMFTPLGGNPMDANADSDGDGVGDGCDPDIIPVSSGGDHILHFAGFKTQPGGSAVIQPSSGSWSFNGTQAVATITTVSGFATIGWPAPSESVTRMVWAQVTHNTTTPPTQTGAGVIDNASATANTGIACLQWQSNTPQVALVNMPATSLNGQTTGFGTYVLKMRHNLNSSFYSCEYSGGVFNTSNGAVTQASPIIGVRASGVSASFDWVMVVD